MKLVMACYANPDKCKICIKIETKKRSIRKEEDRIHRWRKEASRSASIDKAMDTIDHLTYEIENLTEEKEKKKRTLCW